MKTKHKEKFNESITIETRDFSSEVYVLTITLVPIVSTTLGSSVAKRCYTNLIHTIGHRKNLPQVW
jgi:hypothetical protein